MFAQLFSSIVGDVSSPQQIEKIITDILAQYNSACFPKGIKVCADHIVFHHEEELIVDLALPFPCQGELNELADAFYQHLQLHVYFNVIVQVKAIREHQINNVTNIIAVSSAKGGVGKSTTSVNLAYALIAEGAKVGILDADIYGPSIPTMLGLKGQQPSSGDGKLLTPLIANDLSAMSIGFLVKDEDATVWRGPMASKAFNQLLTETDWPELDYLLIDMPPGTGDIQLTLAQNVPVAASVIVTTPQDIALKDAVKGLAMFEKVSVPVLGIIENMSYHICKNCGHESHIFGQQGGVNIAKEYNTTLLGQLPLNIDIRLAGDNGCSSIFENSTSEITQQYRKLARNVAAQCYLQLDKRSPLSTHIDFTFVEAD